MVCVAFQLGQMYGTTDLVSSLGPFRIATSDPQCMDIYNSSGDHVLYFIVALLFLEKYIIIYMKLLQPIII